MIRVSAGRTVVPWFSRIRVRVVVVPGTAPSLREAETMTNRNFRYQGVRRNRNQRTHQPVLFIYW